MVKQKKRKMRTKKYFLSKKETLKITLNISDFTLNCTNLFNRMKVIQVVNRQYYFIYSEDVMVEQNGKKSKKNQKKYSNLQ